MENKLLEIKDLVRLPEEDILNLYRWGYKIKELNSIEEFNSYIKSLAGCAAFTIVAGAATFNIGTPVGPASVPAGTTTPVTFTVLVTNTGSSSGGVVVTLYEGNGNTTISIKGTSTIAPGGSETLTFTFSVVGWANGNMQICAK